MMIESPISLSGKIAIVTGARQGLGKVFAEALAKAGAEVILMARNVAALEKAAAEIQENTGSKCHWYPLDVQDEASVEAAAEHVKQKFGRLDILVNNAAVGRGSTPLQDVTLEEWNLAINTNLTGTFLCMKHFGRIMIAQKYGKIINLASLASKVAFHNTCTGSYDCSKAGVFHLTRCMAGEWAKYNINVNSISPGFFLTDINKQYIEEHPGFYEDSCKYVPLGRWGNPPEIGTLAVFLASDAASYITGADFPIDGGYPLW